MDVIPALELILGSQPPVPELEPKESQNRFMLTFQNFVGVLAQADHPLTLFIDDWQWADSASQWLLQLLLEDDTLKYLLIIGAYRDNEVTSDHPFSLTLQSLETAEAPVTHMQLTPLQEDSISQL